MISPRMKNRNLSVAKKRKYSRYIVHYESKNNNKVNGYLAISIRDTIIMKDITNFIKRSICCDQELVVSNIIKIPSCIKRPKL